MSPSHNKLSIETITPNICNNNHTFIEYRQPLNYQNTHTNTFLHIHRYDEDASYNVTARFCLWARHVSILRYPRGMPCAPITTQRSSLLTNSSAYLVHACNISGRWQAPRSTRKTNSEGIARRVMSSARRAESS